MKIRNERTRSLKPNKGLEFISFSSVPSDLVDKTNLLFLEKKIDSEFISAERTIIVDKLFECDCLREEELVNKFSSRKHLKFFKKCPLHVLEKSSCFYYKYRIFFIIYSVNFRKAIYLFSCFFSEIFKFQITRFETSYSIERSSYCF